MKVKSILVSQPRPTTEKSPYFDMARQYGVEIDFHQFIRVESVTPKEFRAQKINILDYTAILFNSRHGIDHFFHLCEEMRVSVPESMHYYCISESIANYLQKYIQYRKRKVFFGTNNKFEDVIPAMLRRPTEKFLMVVSDIHTDETIQMFASHNIIITPAVMYRTVTNEFSEEDKAKNYDMFVLFTPAGVKALKTNYPNLKPGDKHIACFGPSTLAALREEGFEPQVIAPTPQYPSITAALNDFLAKNALEKDEPVATEEEQPKPKKPMKKIATKTAPKKKTA